MSMGNRARIKGTVVYREGDGPNITIPEGMCEFQESELDVTLSWVDGDTHGSTAIPTPDFKRYVANKDIEVLETTPD